MLDPPAEWEIYRQSALPDPKIGKDGFVMYERWPTDPNEPEPLLDFPHLPDQVATLNIASVTWIKLKGLPDW